MPANERSPNRLLAPRLDLGLFASMRGLPKLLAPNDLWRDAGAGLVLAASTLPLALLLASLAGAPASSGILTAGIGSLVCVLFGGTRSALSGPGLTTALVASTIIARHGLEGLGMVLYLAGMLQVATGALGFGRFVRLVPLSVLRGCVFGMGLVLLLRPLSHVLGAPIEPLGNVLAHFDGLSASLTFQSVAMATCAGLLGALGFLHAKIPGALLAVVAGALSAHGLGLELPMLHESQSFPLPRRPIPSSGGFVHLFGSVFELWGAMTVATAVNTLALEKYRGKDESERTDPDQELIGNGLATVALAFLHGLPASQLIARSAIAKRLGISSRRPALIQAFFVLVLGLAAFPFLHRVPLPALTGIAIFAALPLLDPRPLLELGRVSRVELVLCVATIASMVFFGIATGLVAGLALAFGRAALGMARTRALVHRSRDPQAPHQISFSGPVTFLAALEFEALRSDLGRLEPSYGLVVDLRSVVAMDGNGALALVAALDSWRARGGKVALLGPSMYVREKIARADDTPRALPPALAPGGLKEAFAPNDRMLDTILDKPGMRLARPQLLAGLARFREEKRDHYDTLFAQLADGQHPHTMFITCADSRVDPALLMGSHPGDLFVVRAIGSLVAHSGCEFMPQEGAAVEYGVAVLGVRTIVVCGHSKCGAISALKKGKVPDELTTLKKWSEHAASVAGDVQKFDDVDMAIRAVTVRQIENLMTYPIVREKHAQGELHLHAWFYDLGKVELYEWDAAKNDFVVLGAETRLASLPPGPRLEAAAES